MSGYAAYRERQQDLGPTLSETLVETFEQDMAEKQGRQQGLFAWSMKVPEPKTGTLDFSRYPFQKELYQALDDVRDVAVMKATQVGACLTPDTRVLAADLRWVRIGSLALGDQLLATEEEPRPTGSGRRGTRRLQQARVTAIWETRKPGTRLTFDDGTVVVASPEHRLLGCRPYGMRRTELRWTTVAKMRVGDQVRRIVTPWDAPDLEDAWFAGIIDGEGSLRRRQPPTCGLELVVTQAEGPVLERIQRYLDECGYAYRRDAMRKPNGKIVVHLVLTRTDEILRIIGRTRPTRFTEDPSWWVDGGLPGKGAAGVAWRTIVAKESVGAGKMPMVDIETTTGTFIAEGLVSHNSSYLVRWTMHAADVQGKTSLYVFPKQKTMLDFSDARVRPLIMGSEHLRARVLATHVQNKGLKQVGLGLVYFRGSETKDGLESVDADRLALDEYDLLTQENIPVAEQRLSNSPDPRIRRIGWPSIPDWGMHDQFQRSDQRQWRVRCTNTKGGCKEGWQTIDFYENVDLHKAIIVCKACAKPLNVAKGEWVAEYPEREKRGYHLPRQIVPHQDLRQMIAESKKKKPYEVQNFWNRWLGMPYVTDENRLSAKALAAAERPYTMEEAYVNGDALVTMGVDVASARALNVRISLHTEEGRKGALWIGEVESFDELATKMQLYDVRMCVIDHMPEHRLARAFAERFAGRVYLVRYAGPAAIKVLDVDEEMSVITVRRTEALDATFQMIREQRNELPMDRPADYDRQMMAPVRFIERDELDRIKIGYRSTGPDDYAHAEAYDLIAKEAWNIRQGVMDFQREQYQPLDDLLEFKRQGLNDDDMGYSAGPADEYSPGMGEEPGEWG